jgi:hypothetical protein
MPINRPKVHWTQRLYFQTPPFKNSVLSADNEGDKSASFVPPSHLCTKCHELN